MFLLISLLLFQHSTMSIMAWEKVRIEEYYGSRCKFCKKYYTNQLALVVKKLKDYVDLRTFPFGNAKMKINGENITFECQHGPAECYGNALHACAIYYLPEKSFYVPYNACLMLWDSTDQAADQCSINDVVSGIIKSCAKGRHVVELLKYYALETAKLTDRIVTPYTVVNGKVLKRHDCLIDQVCGAFKDPPEECQKREERKKERKNYSAPNFLNCTYKL